MRYKTVYISDGTDFTCDHTEISTKDLILKDMLKYPNNSIQHKNVYENLLKNLDKISLDDIEELLYKNKCL